MVSGDHGTCDKDGWLSDIPYGCMKTGHPVGVGDQQTSVSWEQVTTMHTMMTTMACLTGRSDQGNPTGTGEHWMVLDDQWGADGVG